MESGVQAAFRAEVTVMCQLKGEKKKKHMMEYYYRNISLIYLALWVQEVLGGLF